MINDNTTFTERLNRISLHHRYSLSEDLFTKLRDMILTGHLPAGYVFPNENELCKMFEVGRSTLREAYSRLATLNLITRSKAGTYVNDIKTVQNSVPFDTMVKASDLSDLMEFRYILEVEIAAIAATKATEENVVQLEEYNNFIKSNVDNVVAITIYDTQLHLSIAKIAGNALLYSVFEIIRCHMESLIYRVFANDQHTILTAIDFHAQIIDAIKARDSERARAVMQNHMRSVSEQLGT